MFWCGFVRSLEAAGVLFASYLVFFECGSLEADWKALPLHRVSSTRISQTVTVSLVGERFRYWLDFFFMG